MEKKINKDSLKLLYGISCSECNSNNIEIYHITENFLHCKCLDCKHQFDIRRGEIRERYRRKGIKRFGKILR